MSSIRYPIATTGSKEDDRRIKTLQKKNIKVIEIVRRGLTEIEGDLNKKESV